MKKFSKIINKETKQCEVGLGTNVEFYKSIGMTEMDVEQTWDGSWYVAGYAPEKPAPTKEEIKQMRKAYRQSHIDDNTAERSRKMANGTWMPADEAAYLALDAEVTAYIEENMPYPIDPMIDQGE